MIGANELRIENWLEYDGRYARVNGIINYQNKQEVDVESLSKPEGSFSACGDFKDFNPIPLTPEILEKAEFEKGALTKDIDENFFLTFFGDKCKLQIEKDDDYGHYIVEYLELHHIKYVHQLQNLYFALSGQELVIKL